MVTKYILFIFSLFLLIKIRFINSVCTKNVEFPELTTQKDVTLCDQSGDCNIKYLSDKKVYTGCSWRGGPRKKLIFEVLGEKMKRQYGQIFCLENNVWTGAGGCQFSFDVTFVMKDVLERFSYYSVQCADYGSQQFPTTGYEFVKLVGYDDFKFQNKKVVLLPTLKLKCVPYCKESQVQLLYESKWTQFKEMYDAQDRNIVRIGLQPLKESANYSLSYTCKTVTVKSLPWRLDFFLINSDLVGHIKNVRSDIHYPRTFVDAGESIECVLEADYNKMSYTPTITQININFIDKAGNIINKFNDIEFKVPENLQTKVLYNIKCFLGNTNYNNALNHMSQYFYLIKTFEVKIKAKFKTAISYLGGKNINDFDIENNSQIMCNKTYYKQFFPNVYIDIRIRVMYSQNSAFPYSKIIYETTTILNEPKENAIDFIFLKSTNTFVYCSVNKFITTPVLTKSGTRQQVKIFNVFPPWDSKYTIKGFVYGCRGTHSTRINFECLNCTEVTYRIKTISKNEIYMFFNKDFSGDDFFAIICKAYIDNYGTKIERKVLRVISSSENPKLNKTFSFFMENDPFNCAAKLFISNRQPIFIAMPTKLSINDKTYVTSETKQILYLHKSGKSETTYKACCLEYSFDAIDCALTDILVGKSYIVEWSKNLLSIYPGNTIQCHACVNYTMYRTHPKCRGKKIINQVIGIKTVFPSGPDEVTYCEDGKYIVTSPKQYVSDVQTSITDQTSVVTCCLKRKYEIFNLGLKSCDEDPPDIKILPLDKNRFVVNDIFTCTTDNLDCQQGIRYSIQIKNSIGISHYKESSYKFKYVDIGNRVHIECRAGIKKLKKYSRRTIRLEQEPFDVNIMGLYNMMWPATYLTCSAKGFPKPTISWIQTGGLSPLRVSENFLLIGPWDISGDFAITCQAKNKQGKSSVHATFKVFNPEIPEKYADSSFYLLIIISTTVCLIIQFASLLLIFQESFFGVPFFSTHVASKTPMQASRIRRVLSELDK